MALTRVTQGVIKPGESFDTHNIISTGIVTAAHIKVGTAVTIASGVITATAFYGDGTNLSGVGVGTQSSINTSGIVTATKFVGDGSELTGIGGVGDPQSGTGNINYLFTSPELLVLTGIHTVNPEPSTGKIVFTASKSIQISSGSTLSIGTGTTIRTNVLNLY